MLCPLGKAFEKQIKTIEYAGQKQVVALKDLKDDKKRLVMLTLIMIMKINYYIQENEKYLEIFITKSLTK